MAGAGEALVEAVTEASLCREDLFEKHREPAQNQFKRWAHADKSGCLQAGWRCSHSLFW